MQFLEDLANYNQSMENAYLIITNKKTLEDIYIDVDDLNTEEFYLPFNPLEQDGKDNGTLDLLIEHFSSLEEYEKCTVLSKLKDQV